jgi:uncharacterized FlaG/YvyC family protein
MESVSAVTPVEFTKDEHLVTDLATELQVHRVKQPQQPDAADAFERSGKSEEAELVWLRQEKKAVYRVIEAETGEVIQQVPSEEVLRVGRNIERFLISGDLDSDQQT